MKPRIQTASWLRIRILERWGVETFCFIGQSAFAIRGQRPAPEAFGMTQHKIHSLDHFIFVKWQRSRGSFKDLKHVNHNDAKNSY